MASVNTVVVVMHGDVLVCVVELAIVPTLEEQKSYENVKVLLPGTVAGACKLSR